MVLFTILVIVVVAYELFRLMKLKYYREGIALGSIAIFTLALGYYYLSNPNRDSFSKVVLEALNFK